MTLFWDYLRRSFKVVLIIGSAVFAFQALMIRVYIGFVQNQQDLARSLPRGLQSFFGMDRLAISSLTGFLSVAYQHPFMLATLVALPVVILSGLLTGDVERRISAFILSRPVGRIRIVLSAVAVFIVCAVICVGAALLGTHVGGSIWNQKLPPFGALFTVALNLFFLLLAVAGLCAGISSVCTERSDATGWTVTIVLLMYVTNFVAQLWANAKPLAEYSLFRYYGPTRIFLGGSALWYDFQVLGIVAAIGTLYACLMYRFRDFNV